MAELGSTGSDDDNDINNDDDDQSSTSSNGDDNNNNIIKTKTNGKLNDKHEESNNHTDDVDDDELERLARINAEFNTNNLGEKPLQPKGANFLLKIYFIHLQSNKHRVFLNPNSIILNRF
jgi:hypothetical protein